MPSHSDKNHRLNSPCTQLQPRPVFQQKPVASTVLPHPING
jgi:hypothetical protein